MGVHIWTPRIEEDGIWDALQPWSNTRPWSDTSPEPLDVLVASVTETKEVLPLVERFRRGQRENHRENWDNSLEKTMKNRDLDPF
jgi:hypothetical protein